MNAIKTAMCVLALVPFTACGEPPMKKDATEIVVISDDFESDEIGDGEPTMVEVSDFSALEIELTWNTPSDPDQTDQQGTDLDLHFVHPSGTWNEEPYDINRGNPTADWGEPGPEDDPILEVDDNDGRGPELLSYDGVEDDMYFEVGVHYVDDGGFGVSYPTVRVFRDGELMFQRDSRLEVGGFWRVARVSVDNALLLDVISTDMPQH